jgi:hypothetical protein
MKSINVVVILAALVTTACNAGTGSPSVAASSPAAAASTPAAATASPSAGPPSLLEGTWATGETTCAEQNAAVQAAGFTAEQMTLAGWSPTCTGGMPHGSKLTIRFAAGRLLIYQDGEVGWDGLYRIVSDQTFEAGDQGNAFYITYHYAVDGNQLTIDMIRNDCPYCTSEADLQGELLAQTVIYETSPFTKQP